MKKQFSTDIASLKQSVDEKDKLLVSLRSECDEKVQLCETIHNDLATRDAEISSLSSKLSSLSTQNGSLSKEKNELLGRYEDTEKNLQEAKNEIEKLRKENENICIREKAIATEFDSFKLGIQSEISDKEKTVQRYEEQLNQSFATIKSLEEKVEISTGQSENALTIAHSEIQTLTANLAMTSEEKTILRQEVDSLTEQLKVSVAKLGEAESEIETLTRKLGENVSNVECLHEQLESARGSKQELQQANIKIDHLTDLLQQSTNKMSVLQCEIDQMKSAQQAEVENLSSELAAKSKENAHLNEQFLELTAEKQQLEKEVGQLTEKCEQFDQFQEKIIRIEAENSKMKSDLKMKEDELERLSATMSPAPQSQEGVDEEIGKIKSELSAKNELVAKLKNIALKAKKETKKAEEDKVKAESALAKKVNDFMDWHKKQESELESYKSELDAKCDEVKKLQEKSENFQMLQMKHDQIVTQKAELEDKIREITTDRARLSSRITELESKIAEFERSSKESGMLSMEVADCNRRMATMREQINAQKAELDSQMEMNKVIQDDLNAKDDKIKDMNSRLSSLSEVEKHLNDVIFKTNTELEELKSSKLSLAVENDSLRASIEDRQSEIERLRIELSKTIAEKLDAEQKGKMLKGQSEDTVFDLKTQLEQHRKEVKKLKDSNAELKKEFDSYKARALTVLKQQKEGENGVGSIAHLKDRIAELEQQISDTNSQLAEANVLLESSKLENKMNKAEIERSRNALQNLENEVEPKVAQLEADLALVRQQRDEAMKESSTKSMQMSADFRRELSALSERHDAVVKNLGEQLTTAENKISELQMVIDRRESYDIAQHVSVSQLGSQPSELHTPTAGAMSPVSPSHVSTSNRVSAPIVPLESLLNFTSANNVNSAASGAVSPMSGISTPAAFTQLNFTERSGNGGRISRAPSNTSISLEDHLRDLLAESEANVSRLTEQTRVLKEEIRRLERNQARSERISNLEYLKHIVVKVNIWIKVLISTIYFPPLFYSF